MGGQTKKPVLRPPARAVPVRPGEYPEYTASYFPTLSKIAGAVAGFAPLAALGGLSDYLHRGQKYVGVDGERRPFATAAVRDILSIVGAVDSTNHTPTRVYSQTVLGGRTAPITEKDFSAEELAQLRLAASRGAKRGSIQFRDYMNPEYMAAIQARDMQLRLPKRTDTGDWNNILGRANLRRGADGSTRVVDTYDFNNYEAAGARDGHQSEAAKTETGFFSPVYAASWLGRRVLPSGMRGVPVNINLGMPGGKK